MFLETTCCHYKTQKHLSLVKYEVTVFHTFFKVLFFTFMGNGTLVAHFYTIAKHKQIVCCKEKLYNMWSNLKKNRFHITLAGGGGCSRVVVVARSDFILARVTKHSNEQPPDCCLILLYGLHHVQISVSLPSRNRLLHLSLLVSSWSLVQRRFLACLFFLYLYRDSNFRTIQLSILFNCP